MSISVNWLRRVACVGCIAGVVLVSVCLRSAAGKTKPKTDTPAEEPPTSVTVSTMPALLELTLKVDVLVELYDLDATLDQAKAMRTAAADAADARQRPAAKATAKLNELTKSLHDAILTNADADRIRDLRQEANDEEDEDGVELDHAVKPSDASRLMAAAVVQKFKASQVAAYLAEHAEEVSDPVELMTDTLAAVRSGESTDEEMHQACERVGALVGGSDAVKSKAVSLQVSSWIAGGRALKDDAFAEQTSALEDSAKKIVGTISPIQVLSNWLEYNMAVLMANPQFIPAADEWIAAKSKKPEAADDK